MKKRHFEKCFEVQNNLLSIVLWDLLFYLEVQAKMNWNKRWHFVNLSANENHKTIQCAGRWFEWCLERCLEHSFGRWLEG